MVQEDQLTDYTWILIHSDHRNRFPDWHAISLANGYELLINEHSNFISGLNSFKNEIVFFLGKSKVEINEEYFTKITSGNIIEISIDNLGISKVFYGKWGDKIVVSNNLNVIQRKVKSEVSRKNILKYLLFNYFILGDTLFKSIRYLLRNQKLKIYPDGRFKVIHESGLFVPNHDYSGLSLNEKVDFITSSWIDYFRKLGIKETGLSMTAGFDSRMILSALLQEKVQPIGFTFGNPHSRDAKVAAEIAFRLKLHHLVEDSFTRNIDSFTDISNSYTQHTHSLGSFLRAYRLAFTDKMRDYTNNLMWGFAGSELIRGMYPDKLMASQFYLELVNKGFREDHLSRSIQTNLMLHRVKFDNNDIDQLVSFLKKNEAEFTPLNYLLTVIIPLHFGADLVYLTSLGFINYAPYITESFIKSLFETNLLALYSSNNELKNSHLGRINNPKISSMIINKLNPVLAKIPLTKGYTPKDYLISKYWAGLKFIRYKYIRKENYPKVFNYNMLLKDFIRDCVLNNDYNSIVEYNRSSFIEDLNKLDNPTEIELTKFTRFINLGLLNNNYLRN